MNPSGLAVSLTVFAMLIAGCSRDGPEPDPDNNDDIPDDTETSEHHRFAVEVVTDGLEHPWAMVFLPDDETILVTERPGRLSRVNLGNGERVDIDGAPSTTAVGQGGMLDVALHPAFEENGWIYLTYAGADEAGNAYATHLGRGRLVADALEDFEVLHVATPFLGGGQHFGSRIAFDAEGHVYFTVGDRGDRDRAQNLSDHMGTTMRLTADGEIPDDNPFVDDEEALPAIYSYGHRNTQGMTVHPRTGRIWQHDHGPSGGDEINLPEAGGNFGWPLTSYGVEYGTGLPIGPDPHDHEGTIPPIYHWEESFAPSGMTFYEGDAFSDWQGSLFVGALALEHLARLTVDGEEIIGEERLLEGRGWRVRDVKEGPDGFLYLLVDAGQAPMVRLVPVE